MIKVLLADDHQMVIDGLAALLKDESDIELVGKALDGRQVLELMKHVTPDVVILDINMPGMNGIDTLEAILQSHPNVLTIAVTMSKDPQHIKAMMDLGVKGYILKNKGHQDLVKGIRKVARGEEFFSEGIYKAFFDYFRTSQEKQQELERVAITNREKEVLEQIAEGLSAKEIADKLCIAKTTVETHKKNLMEKLGIKKTTMLVRYAVENGFVRETGAS